MGVAAGPDAHPAGGMGIASGSTRGGVEATLPVALLAARLRMAGYAKTSICRCLSAVATPEAGSMEAGELRPREVSALRKQRRVGSVAARALGLRVAGLADRTILGGVGAMAQDIVFVVNKVRPGSASLNLKVVVTVVAVGQLKTIAVLVTGQTGCHRGDEVSASMPHVLMASSAVS